MDFIKLRGLHEEIYINVDNVSSLYKIEYDGHYMTKIYIHGESQPYLVYDPVNEIFDKIMLLREVRITND